MILDELTTSKIVEKHFKSLNIYLDFKHNSYNIVNVTGKIYRVVCYHNDVFTQNVSLFEIEIESCLREIRNDNIDLLL